jgi:putative flavoprotein involved in K+ transport
VERTYEVIIIGAGQAGLAAAQQVAQRTRNLVVLEASPRLGASWRERYDSLVLFTPAEYDGLPGLPMGLPRGALPTKDQMADYLERYAAHFELPVRLGEPVQALTQINGQFSVTTTKASYRSARVIIATGAFQTPKLPSYHGQERATLVQLHSSAYRNPGQLPSAPVLVVGAGNSAAQIAEELSQERPVVLSVREPLRFRRTRLFGASLFFWGDKLGFMHADRESFIGRRLRRAGDPIFGGSLQSRVASGAVRLRPEIARIDGDTVHFVDGSAERFGAIVWGTGFRSSYPWLKVDGALDANGQPLQQRGLSPVSGLAYLGLAWQRARNSALVMGAGRDASWLVSQLLGAPRREEREQVSALAARAM